MDNQEKKGRGRPRKTMEALVHRGLIPETWKDDILSLGRRGKNKLHFANYLGITRNTLYRIMERDPDFLHTINTALELSQMWWLIKWVKRMKKISRKSLTLNYGSTTWLMFIEMIGKNNQ